MTGKALSILFLFGAALGALAQPEGASPLPTDPRLSSGVLDNGLAWYLYPAEGETELRLVVGAGAVREEADQKGAAGLVEPADSPVKAYVSLEETLFSSVLERGESLEDGLVRLRERVFFFRAPGFQADFQELREAALDAMLVQDATARMTAGLYPVLFQDSPYGDVYSDKESALAALSPQRAREFYGRWYRPDNMSLIIVGESLSAQGKKLIEQVFGSLPRGSETLPPLPVLPSHSKTRYAIQTDPEAAAAVLEVINKFTPATTDSPEAWDRYFKEQLFLIMFNRRITALLERGDAGFIQAYASMGAATKGTHLFQWGVMTAPGQMSRGFRSLWTEVERVRRYGFTRDELDRAAEQLSGGYRYALSEELDPAARASLLTSAITTGDAFTPLDWEFSRLKALLNDLTPEDVRAVGEGWFSEKDRVISYMGRGQAPSETQIRAVMTEVEETPLLTYDKESAFSPLMTTLPSPGKVVNRHINEKTGLITWTLSNGARIILDQTDFQEDEVVFRAVSPGGLSLVSPKDLIPAMLAAAAVEQSGLGTMTPEELHGYLKDKRVGLSPLINEYEERLEGYAYGDDLEILFQLIHLTFTAPLYRREGWDAFEGELAEYLNRLEDDPEEEYREFSNRILYRDHPRIKELTGETLKEMDYPRAYAVFRQRFFDADDFTFYFTGDFDQEEIERLASTYLASLISIPESEDRLDRGIRFNKSATRASLPVRRGADRVLTSLIYTGDLLPEKEEAYRELHRISLLAPVLESYLADREELTVSVSVDSGSHLFPVPEYALILEFACSESEREDVMGRLEKGLDEFVGDGLISPYCDQVRTNRLQALDREERDNSTRQSSLAYLIGHDLPLTLSQAQRDETAALSPPTIRETARRVLSRSARLIIAQGELP